jgi:adenine-specific DNA-methyltransferase
MFAGTGIVGRTFKSEVKQVIANDCEYYSYVLNRNYIGNHTEIAGKERYIEKLNALVPTEKGIVFNHYCLGGGAGRQYFTDGNGKKIDTIRQKIEEWKQSGKINANMYYFLLASLLESTDKVANTTSVYCSFLKYFEPSAQKELVLTPAQFIINSNEHKVFNMDSNALIRQIEGDILYLDPPYNNRQYGALYHLLNTIAHYDRFQPKGKTGLREYGKSHFCYKSEVEQAFADLIENAHFRYIFLSYNNEGLMPMETIRAIMKKYGKYDFAVTDYQRFKADKIENRTYKADHTQEYLHILEKRN